MNVICKASVLKTVVQALRPFVSEAKFRFNDGLNVRAVDASNVAMVIVNVPLEAFEAFDAKGEVVGVDIDRLNDLLKRLKKDDLIDLVFDGETIKLRSGNMTYELKAIEPSAIRREPKQPNLDLPAKITLKVEEVKKFISLARNVSDSVIFRTDDKSFYVEARGDIDRLVLEVDSSDLEEFEGAEAKSMFGLEYLEMMLKVASSDDLLTIYLGTDYPVRLRFDIDGVVVEYFLAPRIEA